MVYVWLGAWATGLWALFNNFKKGRADVPPALWWTTLPFFIIGGPVHAIAESAPAGIAVGVLAAVAVHLWASARTNKKRVRKADAASYIGRQGVVTRSLHSTNNGSMEGSVQIDSDRNVYAIAVKTTRKLEIPVGGRVRVVGHDGGDRIIVEPIEKFADGYLLH